MARNGLLLVYTYFHEQIYAPCLSTGDVRRIAQTMLPDDVDMVKLRLVMATVQRMVAAHRLQCVLWKRAYTDKLWPESVKKRIGPSEQGCCYKPLWLEVFRQRVL